MQKRKIGLVERVLLRLFKHKDIRKQINGEWSLYLRRFYVLKLFGWAVFIHIIFRSDEDRCLHSHPWKWASLILKGGYEEELFHDFNHPIRGTYRRRALPGSFSIRSVNSFHRLHLINGKPTWTMFIHGPRKQEWGFMTETGWVPFYKFLQAGSEVTNR